MRRVAAPALGLLGLAVIVAGTFLPWLDSGRATRNSYQASGAARRLLDVSGWLGGALQAWPFVGLVCAAVVVLYALGLPRGAAGLGLLTGALAAAVAIGALTVHGNGLVAPATRGPAVTIAGATAVIIASTLLLLQPQTRATRS
ncbi:MAG: hypothetical protein QOH14_2291 [Pseudonocardiales bacterium]|nr:hypothetical protein [Pseudonocardiales bacterium]